VQAFALPPPVPASATHAPRQCPAPMASGGAMGSKPKKWLKGQALSGVAQISEYLHARLAWRGKEIFAVVFLDTKSRIIWGGDMFRGGRDSVTVSVAEIARAAYRHGAHSVIVSHNHPTGDPTPSVRDIRLTRRLRLVMALAGVPLLDHIIVSTNAVHSMAQLGPWDAPLEEFAALLEAPDSEERS